MNEDVFKITIKIADAAPFQLKIKRDEEIVYRKAEHHVNELWAKWRQALKNESSQDVLARVALATAELFYRKTGQLDQQAQMIDDFEKQLDKLLKKVE